MHKTKRSSVGLVAAIVITAYATNPNYSDQMTLRHIKNYYSL
ncbi:hypothetical protein TERTU_4471 [Teredinibacter turnerae T7901]|uniref:Uncharacterized protein n=1 Tax=Teredinibacter turnerae (strain ATCC 39867 / T7901) TaxID=377629 RepID=C5BJ61_TERTT|nr:hypothetical protein TERTU_4471 [Teredinibacter turnerae T7901]